MGDEIRLPAHPPLVGPPPGAQMIQGANTPSGHPALREAATDVAQEAAALVALDAIKGDALLDLTKAVATIPMPRAEASEQLVESDYLGRSVLKTLLADGIPLSEQARTALGPLPKNDLMSAESDKPISINADVYLNAIDQLLHHNGVAPQPPVPLDTVRIAQALDPGVSGCPGCSSNFVVGRVVLERSNGEPRDKSGLSWPLVAGGVPLVVAAALCANAVRRRRHADARLRWDEERNAGSSGAPQALMDSLLEVSRRLTSAASTGDIDRVLVRETINLVPSAGAALIHRRDEGFMVKVETEDGLLIPEGLAEGVVRRVAETGQLVVQVSATERAIRSLPAALAVVPLVMGGRVEAVLVLVRRDSEPFTLAERNVLQSFAPVAGAALQNAREARSVIEESLIDPLTGIGNRRRFDAELPRRLAESAQTALFMVDLDHFKSVNDTYGHPAGDAVLRGVASCIETTIRPDDRVYRLGGEEFCVVLADTDAYDAGNVAERVREAIAGTPFDIGSKKPVGMTTSIGVALSTAGPDDAVGLLGRADAALYEAKRGGRNRVVAATVSDAEAAIA